MKSLEKKLETLCRKHNFDTNIKLGFQKFLEHNNLVLSEERYSYDVKKTYIDKNLIVNLFIQLEISETDAVVYWFKKTKEQKTISDEFLKTPIKNIGTDIHNPNNIKFPKKGKKSAWKKFWKLFPYLYGFKTYNEFVKKVKGKK